jgi:hypothetical protein
MGTNLDSVLTQVVQTHDNYALQAFISELERSGAIDGLLKALEEHHEPGSAANILLDVLTKGRKKLEQSGQASAAAAGAR